MEKILILIFFFSEKTNKKVATWQCGVICFKSEIKVYKIIQTNLMELFHLQKFL
jgi:hypothetical protein